ncbi:MAG: LLM class flavin-dependent oxidoreductase [Acidimicrobiia bacterium]|nr:LLM class flavin-dependent oxidoreductase [Acidimicrobiia bacterium]MXY73852.1 LLM class flavin-dependent oxidoreductase [Acidimicrobiia bacterium]MYD41349.1 LLM class flavin-dependent oxidoreductase [Acidimicrobiia bacterium]
MELGVSLVDPGLSAGRLTEIAARAEQLGYSAAWTNESTAREAFSTLAGWATATSRIRLATGVLPVYVRSPVAAAMGAATISAIAGPGRMVLGIGAGHPVAARRFFNFDLSSPLDAVSDYLKIVGELRNGRKVTHHGRFFSVEGARLGLLPSGPVWTVVGAMGPRMLELAVREADGVLLNWCSAAHLRATTEWLRGLGRGASFFHIAAYVRVAVSSDPDEARRALAEELGHYLRLGFYRRHVEKQGLDPDDLRGAAAHLGIAGTAEECRAQLDSYRSVGLDELIVRPVPVTEGGLEPAVEVMAPAQR